MKFAKALSCLLTLSILSPHLVGQTRTDEYPHPGPMAVTHSETGIVATNSYESLEVTLCSQGVVHVVARPAGAVKLEQARPWMLETGIICPGTQAQFQQAGDLSALHTAGLRVELSAKEGSLRFKGSDGQILLRERGNLPRTYEASEVAKRYRIEARFAPDATEAIYGLGQHQGGLFNYRGTTVELGQNNTDIAIPLLISSKGYGILWNTASFGYVDNRFPLELNLDAAAADQIDYYVLYGPEFDRILHEYRSLTGHAPLLPEWAYGLFQSKDRYRTQKELLGIAAEYRARHIPMDGLVQDWYWWKQGGEGDPVFNEGYTDVSAALKTLHDEHVHAMISAWGLMDDSSETYKQIKSGGYEIPGTHVYDPTNPDGRDLYWKSLPGKLFAMGWDAFWLDSAEPEEAYPHIGDAILRYKLLKIGSGLEYTNIFPFEHNLGVQEHWKQENPEKRVFLLTRSAFLGQQRVGATVWSGDVYASWWALRRQVPAGLNFALSGYPYWTTDIGGYHPLFTGQANQPEYQELYARWFEYGAFCPIFRTHGHRDHNELWVWDKVFPGLLNIDRLRYRLLPYIYSLAWKVTDEDYTIQRPLVMDFRTDPAVHEIGDQFLFGPSILVSPVLREHATSRTAYLPAGTAWIDFWTGKKIDGGREIVADAPLDRIPLNVRAGSIVPMGPEIEYTGQTADPIELRIYPGADSSFTLYEDEGDSYRYEQGAHVTIALHWDDAARTLRVAARQGSYKGMAAGHIFNVVLVREGHGVGETITALPDKAIKYTGAVVEVKF
ncbi:MAG: glycoside hydrolase family 31 protein [Terracidiphilus sp.]|nr:glycoside hydrolase family 31 protein [Terracidiphilus sp.]